MKRIWRVAILVYVAVAATAWGQKDNCTATPKESAHVRGPQGVEGWTLDSTMPDFHGGSACFSFTLVLARNGHEIRRIKGGPILWHWMFWKDGQQVAYEEDSHHFNVACVLEDVETGREIATSDCYHELPKDAPEWVKALRSMD